EREPFCPQVALLHDLLEYVSADQEVENSLLIDRARLRFHVLLDPPPAFAVGDVHEFHANGAAVVFARLAGSLAVKLQVRLGLRSKKAKGIKVGLQVSPVAKRVEHALALEVGSIHEAGGSRCR